MGRTPACLASRIMVELREPAMFRRGAGKEGGRTITVFFASAKLHGRITTRVEEVCRLVGRMPTARSRKIWGASVVELVANACTTGSAPATGLTSTEVVQHEATRRFAIRLGRRRSRSAGQRVRSRRDFQYSARS